VITKFAASFLDILRATDRATRWLGPGRDWLVLAYVLIAAYNLLMLVGT
jgi:TRAP-type mannitol/chloroaromatic compound transport system permease small subunit